MEKKNVGIKREIKKDNPKEISTKNKEPLAKGLNTEEAKLLAREMVKPKLNELEGVSLDQNTLRALMRSSPRISPVLDKVETARITNIEPQITEVRPEINRENEIRYSTSNISYTSSSPERDKAIRYETEQRPPVLSSNAPHERRFLMDPMSGRVLTPERSGSERTRIEPSLRAEKRRLPFENKDEKRYYEFKKRSQ